MAPHGVLALDRVAVGLVAAGVHDLEVVEVAVGLVEVAVTVEVVAVPDVVLGQLRLDVGGRDAGRELVVVPLFSSGRVPIFTTVLPPRFSAFFSPLSTSATVFAVSPGGGAACAAGPSVVIPVATMATVG